MYRQCKRCIMDTSDSDIVFDYRGICNHCIRYDEDRKAQIKEMPNINNIVKRIKADSKEYDCIIGLSGGVDSSYTLHKAVNLGLKPFTFTVDNGWNTKESDENIMRLVEGMKVPFYRYTIDTERFRELQVAFMKAGVRNLEIPTDHILMATTYELADKYNIKWILSGGNIATESIMPASWGYNARDLVHIKDIYKKFTGKRLKGLPTCSLLKFNYYKWVKRMEMVYLLDYYEYNREEAIKELEDKYGYKQYGEKHCESIFTSWFQNYYLFEKFHIDKRKAHWSSLINSGQMTKKEALAGLSYAPVYPKLGFEDTIKKYPIHSHYDYKTDEKLYNFISKVVKKWRS